MSPLDYEADFGVFAGHVGDKAQRGVQLGTVAVAGILGQKHKLVSASSVQSALRGLVEKDIVMERDSIYWVYDVFLEQYITSMFNS